MATQKATVLRLLEARGFKGVSAYEMVYQMGITRGAAIIHDLRTNDGIEIDTIDEGDSKLARYVLHGSNVAPASCVCGHRERSHIGSFKCQAMLNEDDRFSAPVYCDCERFRAAA